MLALAAALGAVACGDDSDPAPGPEPAPTGVEALEPEQPRPGSADPLPVPPAEDLPAAPGERRIDPPDDPREALDHPDPQVRADALLELACVEEDLERVMSLALGDPSAEVRAAAISALEEVEHPRAIDALLAALHDLDRDVVLAAIEALSWREEPAARAGLERLAVSDDPELAAAAREVLDTLE